MNALADRSARLDRADFPVDVGLVQAAAEMAEDEGGRWVEGDRGRSPGRHGTGPGADAREEMVALGQQSGIAEDVARRSVTRGILLALNPPGGIPAVRSAPTRAPTNPRAA